MKNFRRKLFILPVILVSFIGLNACQSIKTFTKKPEGYHGDFKFTYQRPQTDTLKKNVFIVANNKLTELFDMIAPYYLFNSTGKANVYIITENKSPVQILKTLYVLPQITFHEADSLQMHADVIVIPFIGVIDTNQNPIIIDWIKNHYSATTKILSICDGAATAAATGLYDGKPLTCHASDFSLITPHFSKPLWVQQVSVTKSGNLYSTAGVSNAVDGSLMVINDLFGKEIMQKVMFNIHYRYPEIKLDHQSLAINSKAKWIILKKIFFRKNRNVGVMLQNDVNELQLVSVIDTYSRTFPATFKTILPEGNYITTKYGLTMFTTDDNQINKLDELHILLPDALSASTLAELKDVNIIKYDSLQTKYAIDLCIERISLRYGNKFAKVNAMMLDYN